MGLMRLMPPPRLLCLLRHQRHDALERCEKKDGGVVSIAWCCGASGVDGWYTPARTAPVRLLVEAEASPAFLRRARV